MPPRDSIRRCPLEKYKICFLFVLFLTLGPLIFADTGPSRNKSVSMASEKTVQPAAPASSQVIISSTPFVWRKEKNNAFSENEILNFEVAWEFIVVGSASMEVRGIEKVGDRWAYHIYTEAQSAPFFDVFYKVRNTNESWIDTESLCSLKYISNSNEKNFQGIETVLYDQETHKYLILGKGKTGPIRPFSQDVLSALYYIRTRDLVVGGEYVMDAQSGTDSWPLVVRVLRKERVTVPAGKFDCLVLEPDLREGSGIFQATGKLWVWVTDDSKKTPVLMRSKIAVGSVEARLKSME